MAISMPIYTFTRSNETLVTYSLYNLLPMTAYITRSWPRCWIHKSITLITIKINHMRVMYRLTLDARKSNE